MLKIDFSNCYDDKIGEEGISKEDVNAISSGLKDTISQLSKWRESQDAIFFDYPATPGLCEPFKQASRDYFSKYENLVVLGIGGSALGLSFLAGALLPPFYNQFSKGMKLFVCDNVDPDSFSKLMNSINLKKTLFNVISKSGGTVETASQFFLIAERLKAVMGEDWRKNLILTTDPERGLLRAYAYKYGIRAFDIPSKLGGRFSVLSAVGLLPAAIMGINVEGLIRGALTAREYCELASLDENPALHLAAISYLMDVKRKKNISIMLPYADSLKLFADWYAQLWGESLGKEGKGTTPMKALGATDQHSQLQLYMEGPNDKLITFITAEKFREKTDKIIPLMEGFDYLVGKDLGDLINAEALATSGALTQAKRPNITIKLPSLSSQSIGELIFLYETVTALTGALYQINPFDQPGVEIGKKLTKEILSQ
ncbi:MAG: glucose-6-phosphate isomerase [Pseudomonadota bacterium]